MEIKLVSNSESETFKFGEQLGRRLAGGEVVELVSDLGGGKTVFIRGLARGLGYTGQVTSPTFTISRVYNLPDGKQLHHFDFYRLEPGDIVDQELAEVMGDKHAVVAIEWAKHSGDLLPPGRLTVRIQPLTGTERQIIITGPGQLLRGLK